MKARKNEITITDGEVKTLFDTPFIHLYDLQYENDRHYYEATRREKDDIVAVKNEKERRNLLPDAISVFLILDVRGKEPVLLTEYEYRYPIGIDVMGLPAGLVDQADKEKEDPLISAAVRELHEETGITVKESDTICVINPIAFNTPGLSDESTALIACIVHLDDLSSLSQKGAVGSERFDGFELLNEKKAEECLESGSDPNGNSYPLVTWCALMYFASGWWKKITAQNQSAR